MLSALAVGSWTWFRPIGPIERGRSAYERGDWRDAALKARERLKAVPDDREAVTLLARAEARLGRTQPARNLYRQLDLRGLQAEDYFLVGRGLIADRQVENGRFGLERALELDPSHPEALRELFRLDRRSDRLVEAGKRAEKLARGSGWEARGLVLLGIVRREQGDPDAAAEAFGSALARDPKLVGVEEGPSEEVRSWLVRCLLQSGRPIEARAQLDLLLASRPHDPEANWLLSRAALQQHKLEKAKAARAHAGDFGADHPEAYEPAPYVGIARCSGCHPSIFRAQRASRHAQTFRTRGDLQDLKLPALSVTDPVGPDVVHTIAREGRDIRIRTRTPDADMKAIVEFVMGSGDRAMTLVGRDEEGTWRELRMTYYASIADWDRTTGQHARPATPREFLGVLQTDDAVRRCLGCHTTHARAGPDASVATSERGFSCERCHGPAGNHLTAVDVGFPDPAIGRPRLASAAKVNTLCGQCHSVVGRGIALGDPDLARFQASALPMSRCVTSGRESLSCLTCHDPHRDAKTSPAFYEAKCLECHAAKSNSGSMGPTHRQVEPAPGDARRTSCPVNLSRGCLPCHMPQVQTGVPHTTFTDHLIRVHRDPSR